MTQPFTDLEGLRIAVEMEKRGEAFYRRAAKMSVSPQTIALLNALADDEKRHCAEFTRMQALYSGTATPVSYDPETAAYLSAIAADIIFPAGLMSLRQVGFDDAASVLRYAMDSEKDSILFYTELKTCATEERARSVFGAIVLQERSHLARLQARLNVLISETEA